MPKVIFLYRKHPTLQGLVNASHQVCNVFDIEAVSVEKFQNNINKYTDCDVVFEAWLDCYSTLLEVINGRKFVRWQSPSTQMEMSPNGIELKIFNNLIQLKKNGMIDNIFVSDEGLSKSLQPHVEWFPNIFSLSNNVKYKDYLERDGVGLFMTYTARKNLLTNILAANMLRQELHVSNYFNQEFLSPLSFLDVKLVSHECAITSDYYGIISKLLLSMQVTLSESLNFGIVDSLLCGTPVITGYNNPFNGFCNKFDKLCVVQRVDNPFEIYNKSKTIINTKALHHDAFHYGLNVISAYYNRSKEVIGNLLHLHNLI